MSILKLAKIIKSKRLAMKKFQAKAWKHRKLKNGLQKYRCEDCKHVFADQSWTILRWNKVHIEKVAVVNHLSRTNLDMREIAKQSELGKNSALRLKAKIRRFRGKIYQAMAPPQLDVIS